MFERKNENKVKKQFENVGDLIIIMRWLLLIVCVIEVMAGIWFLHIPGGLHFPMKQERHMS